MDTAPAPTAAAISPYSQQFYAQYQDGSRSSAEQVLPLVLDLVRPASVVDVGCGVGTWLSVARERGVGDILGIDGDWVKEEMLAIPAARFMARDLSRRIELDRRFDLVISLEVAEHIAPQYADTFIDSLTGLGPAILFSAAVPMQGGTSHVNEQWPEYWSGRFALRGYAAVDCLRRKLCQNRRVEFWYSQNTFLYVKKENLETFSFAQDDVVTGSPCAWVHRDLYWKMVEKYRQARTASNPANIPFRKALSTLLTASRGALARRWRGSGDV